MRRRQPHKEVPDEEIAMKAKSKLKKAKVKLGLVPAQGEEGDGEGVRPVEKA